MKISPTERDDLEFQLGLYFKPTMPINREDLFSGRRPQVQEVVDAINQQGQHIILYGERGVGKTSLANMIMFKARAKQPTSQVMSPHVSCSSANNYEDIWRSILQDIAYRAEKQDINLPRSVKKIIHDFENELKFEFTPDLARRLVTDLSNANMIVILIIDEIDMLIDQPTVQALAETIKFFSDRNIPGTIVLIGVSDDVDSLIAEHASIERCVVQIRMPRMSRDEIEGIITNTLTTVGMTIEPAALHEISRIAIGLPHYAHLLGLHSGRRALLDSSKNITQPHVTDAIKTATSKAQVTIHNAFCKATISTKKNALYKQVLVACALCETDEYGYFSPTDIKEPLELVLGREYGVEAFARHLHAFTTDERGPVLKKGDLKGRPRFRFGNPLMQPFVLMKGMDERIISEEDLRETRDTSDPQGRLF